MFSCHIDYYHNLFMNWDVIKWFPLLSLYIDIIGGRVSWWLDTSGMQWIISNLTYTWVASTGWFALLYWLIKVEDQIRKLKDRRRPWGPCPNPVRCHAYASKNAKNPLPLAPCYIYETKYKMVFLQNADNQIQAYSLYNTSPSRKQTGTQDVLLVFSDNHK